MCPSRWSRSLARACTVGLWQTCACPGQPSPSQLTCWVTSEVWQATQIGVSPATATKHSARRRRRSSIMCGAPREKGDVRRLRCSARVSIGWQVGETLTNVPVLRLSSTLDFSPDMLGEAWPPPGLALKSPAKGRRIENLIFRFPLPGFRSTRESIHLHIMAILRGGSYERARAPGFHIDRAPGCHRHHFGPGHAAGAGRPESAIAGDGMTVPQQHAADWDCDSDI